MPRLPSFDSWLSFSSKNRPFYPTRLQPHEIRLLKLHASAGLDTVHCQLIETELDKAPAFEALSYVWGNPSVERKINCNKKSFIVSENLYHALLRLRPSSWRSRLIWVDAICINQDDVVERSQQVQIMGSIYSAASRVVVDLGPGDENTMSLALSVARIIYDAFKRVTADISDSDKKSFPSWNYRAARPSDIDAMVRKKHPGLPAWEALDHLYKRQWFTRVWCVQEIILARDAVVLVGHDSTPWKVLGVCASWLTSHSAFGNLVVGDLVKHQLPVGVSFYGCHYMTKRINRDFDQFTILINLLEDFSGFMFSDSRDKIYALLGLVATRGKEQSLIQVDYEKSVAEVHIDVVKAGFKEGRGLRVLSSVTPECHRLQKKLNLPTWVPVWRKESKYLKVGETGNKFIACGPGAADADFSSPHFLTLKGILFDEVVSVTPIERRMEPATDPDDKLTPADPFIDLWHEATADKTLRKERIWELALTLTAGMHHTLNHAEFLTDDGQKEFIADFGAYMANMFKNAGQESKTINPSDITVGCNPDRDRFRIASAYGSPDRPVFRVAGGHIGLGPRHMHTGDIVVVFNEGTVPFLLRPRGDGDYSFIGECYVHDIMWGEAFDEAKLGRPVPEERVFRLR